MREHVAFFGDAEQKFLLDPGMILELERKLGAGIMAISRRFSTGACSLSDLTEVLRLGLIGGGMEPQAAHNLVATYTPRMAVLDLWESALPVIEASMLAAPKPSENLNPGAKSEDAA